MSRYPGLEIVLQEEEKDMSDKNTLYLECRSGISGDMTVAALLDLGATEENLRQTLAKLPVGGYEIKVQRLIKNGLAVCGFDVILEEEAVRRYGYEPVNVVPQLKAGGSFATAAYHAMEHPVAVEEIRADGGMDIGDTLIGMHLKPVAVPVRISVKRIGGANVVCARVRPKFIGGERAGYDPELA